MLVFRATSRSALYLSVYPAVWIGHSLWNRPLPTIPSVLPQASRLLQCRWTIMIGQKAQLLASWDEVIAVIGYTLLVSSTCSMLLQGPKFHSKSCFHTLWCGLEDATVNSLNHTTTGDGVLRGWGTSAGDNLGSSRLQSRHAHPFTRVSCFQHVVN